MVSDDPKVISNPARYREMSVPHDSHEALNSAIEGFAKAVEVGRIEHRLADIVVLVMGRWKDADGAEVTGFSQFSFGESSNVLPMVAHAFGREKANHDALIARLTSKASR